MRLVEIINRHPTVPCLLVPLVFAAGGGGTHILQELPPKHCVLAKGLNRLRV